jgi:nucleoid-associated protein YgaU
MTVAQKVEMDAKLEASKDNAIDGDTYTVAKGDSLWKISVRAYADGYKWTEVAKANNISILNSDRIEVGMELKLPR